MGTLLEGFLIQLPAMGKPVAGILFYPERLTEHQMKNLIKILAFLSSILNLIIFYFAINSFLYFHKTNLTWFIDIKHFIIMLPTELIIPLLALTPISMIASLYLFLTTR